MTTARPPRSARTTRARPWRPARSTRPATLLAAHPDGEGVVVVAGRPSYAESGEVAAEALRVLAGALPKATFLPALRRGNVFGALDMGLAPGILPGRVGLDAGRARFTAAWGSVPDGPRAVDGRDPRLHGGRARRRRRRCRRSCCWAPTR